MWVVGMWSEVLILCGRSFTHWSFPTDPRSAFYLGPEDHTRVFCLSGKYFNQWLGFFESSSCFSFSTVKCCWATNCFRFSSFVFQDRMDLLSKFEIYIYVSIYVLYSSGMNALPQRIEILCHCIECRDYPHRRSLWLQHPIIPSHLLGERQEDAAPGLCESFYI